MGRSGDLIKAIACGADAVMLGAAAGPGRRGARGTAGTGAPRRTTRSCRAGGACAWAPSARCEEILLGPSTNAEGTTNLVGALRRAMATTGYCDLKELQRVEVVVSPYQPT